MAKMTASTPPFLPSPDFPTSPLSPENHHEKPPAPPSLLKSIYRQFRPLFLSHHPNCPAFKDDTFTIGSVRFCMGCFTAFPAFILTFFLGYTLPLFAALSIKESLILGGGLASAYFFAKLPRFRTKPIRIVSKVLVGIGGAFITSVLFKTLWPLYLQAIAALLLLNLVFLGHGILRGIDIYQKCTACEFHSDWDNCPGFGENLNNSQPPSKEL